MLDAFEQHLQAHLHPLRARPLAPPAQTPAGYRVAAVLVPLYCDRTVWHLLFTERSEKVADHKGQVSFPGGQSHRRDTNSGETALREAEEEIGLRRRDVRILGELEPMLTTTDYWVTPVVGSFPWPYTFRLAKAEVREVFGVPLNWLADPHHLEWVERPQPLTAAPVSVALFERYQGHLIWGATARIVLQFLDALGDRGGP